MDTEEMLRTFPVQIGNTPFSVTNHRSTSYNLKEDQYAEMIQSDYGKGRLTFHCLINAHWDRHRSSEYTIVIWKIKLKPTGK